MKETCTQCFKGCSCPKFICSGCSKVWPYEFKVSIDADLCVDCNEANYFK